MKNIVKILSAFLFVGFFTVSAQAYMLVNSPGTGEVWKIGQKKTIEWQKTLSVDLYKIELWDSSVSFDGKSIKGGNVWRINESVAGNSYIWKVGDVDCGGDCTIPSISKYKIVVRDQKKSSVVAVSGLFDIEPSSKGVAVGRNIAVQPQVFVQASQNQKQTPMTKFAQVGQTANILQVAKQVLVGVLSFIKSLFGR